MGSETPDEEYREVVCPRCHGAAFVEAGPIRCRECDKVMTPEDLDWGMSCRECRMCDTCGHNREWHDSGGCMLACSCTMPPP